MNTIGSTRVKMSSESFTHYVINNNFKNLKTININGKINNIKEIYLETRVGRFIPDIKCVFDNDEIAYIEVICAHFTEDRKVNSMSNENRTLLDLDLSKLYEKYKNIYTESDWFNVLSDILTGKNNSHLLQVRTLRNRPVTVELNGSKIKLVSYSVNYMDEKATIIDAMDENGNFYRFFLDTTCNKRTNTKKIKSFAKPNESIFYVKAFYDTWILSLYNAVGIKEY